MVDVIATIARWFQLAANLILLGGCVFLTIVSVGRHAYNEKWIKRLESTFSWLVLIIPVGLLIVLITTILQVTGNVGHLLVQETWINFLTDTRVGQIWISRFAASILLFIVIFSLFRLPRNRWSYLLCAVIATLPLIIGSLASHTAAEDLSITAVLPYTLHLIFAGIWFGALPAFLMLLHEFRQHEIKTVNLSTFETLKRFSALALPVMLLIILTGIVISDRIFDDQYAALVATTYGWLLSSKLFLLAIILLIAWRVRSHWLPVLFNEERVENNTSASKNNIWKWVRIEFFLALGLVLMATIITHTTPVKHAPIENWPFPFRFSVVATWNQPNVALQVWIGFVIAMLAFVVLKLGQLRNWGSRRLITFPFILIISGLAVALPPLTIKAYPETYRSPAVPFDSISIANGAALYKEHCVDCHGLQGKGNGIKSRTLSTKLPDLLVEPHIIEHTPGDFYNWISNGMIDTDMPGYAEKISEEGRWDLVNYIHALSRGYQARILTTEVVSGKAFAKPPVFSFTGHDGNHGTLQEFREKRSVLLVIFSWPQSQERIKQLKLAYNRLSEQEVAVLAVPSKELTPEELTHAAAELPFPLVTQSNKEIADSYALWRRTMSHPDIIGQGTVPDHMEFLIDKYGYMRARWIPAKDQSGWSDVNVLLEQVSVLNREKTKIPFPEDYVR